jgi:membrane protein
VWITPGALVATGLWIISSFAFKWYVTNFSDYTATYGAIGAVIVTMLWFYVGSVAVLVGAEINAVIEAMQAARRPAPAR